MVPPVSLLALASAVPPYVLDQAEVAHWAPQAFHRTFECFPGIAEVFAHTGIAQRHAVRPLAWFAEPHDWEARTAAYLSAAGDLFTAAAQAALDRAGLMARDIDIVVTVSSTGIATPSLEAQVAGRLGLRADAMRVPVFGLGCAGGVTGLALAGRLARAEPGRIVLVVALELCSLAFRFDRVSKTDVVAAALFGDGAAAALVRAGGANGAIAHLGAAAEHTWPDTLDIMGWTIDPIGFGAVLSPALPRFIEDRLTQPAQQFVRDTGFETAPRYVCHLGSLKVLTAIEAALGLQSGTLVDERAVLRENGNMSSPSVLFVFERALRRGLREPAVLAAMGPGFTVSFLAIEPGHG